MLVSLAGIHPVQLPDVRVAEVDALPDLGCWRILKKKKKESRFCFPSPFFIIVNFTYSWQNCRVHPVVGEFRPAVVHHAAIVVLLSVRIDLVLRQFDEVVEVYALCKISLIAW